MKRTLCSLLCVLSAALHSDPARASTASMSAGDFVRRHVARVPGPMSARAELGLRRQAEQHLAEWWRPEASLNAEARRETLDAPFTRTNEVQEAGLILAWKTPLGTRAELEAGRQYRISTAEPDAAFLLAPAERQGAAGTQWQLNLEQPLWPDFSPIHYRQPLYQARAERRAAYQEVIQQRRQAAQTALMRLADLCLAQARHTLARRALPVLAELHRQLQRRWLAGQAAQQALETLASRQRQQQTRALRRAGELEQAVQTLTLGWGWQSPSPRPDPASWCTPLLTWPDALTPPTSQVLTVSAGTRQAQLELQAARHAEQADRFDLWPRLTGFLEIHREQPDQGADTTSQKAGLRFSLPLHARATEQRRSRQQTRSTQAHYELNVSRHRDELERTSLQRQQQQAEAALVLQEQEVNQARQRYQQTQALYRQGNLGINAVLDAHSLWLQAEDQALTLAHARVSGQIEWLTTWETEFEHWLKEFALE